MADAQGRTPLAYAAETGQAAVMRTLIAAGANPNTADVNGVTPLMRSAAHGYNDCAGILLRQPGIDLNQQDLQGHTALAYSMINPDSKIPDQLIKRGATATASVPATASAVLNTITLKDDAGTEFLVEEEVAAVRPALQQAQNAAQTKANRAYEQALQLEAAQLANVRSLETQLAQDEALVEQLKTAQQQAAQHAQDLRDQVAAQRVAAGEVTQQLQPVADTAKAVSTTAASAAARTQTVQPRLRNMAQEAAAQPVEAVNTQVQKAKKQTRKTAAAAQKVRKSTIQDMATLQPRLRSMTDPEQ